MTRTVAGASAHLCGPGAVLVAEQAVHPVWEFTPCFGNTIRPDMAAGIGISLSVSTTLTTDGFPRRFGPQAGRLRGQSGQGIPARPCGPCHRFGCTYSRRERSRSRINCRGSPIGRSPFGMEAPINKPQRTESRLLLFQQGIRLTNPVSARRDAVRSPNRGRRNWTQERCDAGRTPRKRSPEELMLPASERRAEGLSRRSECAPGDARGQVIVECLAGA
jgi:hypothetical protein